ncbi:MAG: dihydroorotase [Bacteroidia bacterium]
MKILITNAIITDPKSKFDNKVCDVFIEYFKIKTIQPATKADITDKKIKIIDAKGCFLIPCFTDFRSHIPDPGFEYKEDFESAANAALYGGFGTIVVLPDCVPAISNKASVEYVINKRKNLPINILPYGSISHKIEGNDLSEMYDMHSAGAVAFTDANNSIKSSGLLLRALMYSKIFNGLVAVHSVDYSLAEKGQMHEGETSILLGMKGIPAMAEEIQIKRDLEILQYADAKIHFSHISTKGSVDLIRKAKKQGLKVTCDVAVANLCFTDENLIGFDTNYKVMPPLRSKIDKKALWDGLADGTIDCIVSDHRPQHTEAKKVEFEYAETGMNTLQTTFNLLLANKPKDFLLQTIVDALSHKPNLLIKQKENSINTNNIANFFLFDPNKEWEFNETTNKSKSNNTPLYNTKIKGKAIISITKNKLHIL